ncbi:MAG: DUF523 domain-containing protein [Bacillota bacterium]
MYIISGCLAGLNCRYDGGNKKNITLMELVKEKKAIPLCPEQLGGFATPRLPVDINSGEDVLLDQERVYDKGGQEVTEGFLKGAYETLKIAEMVKPTLIILKSRSPSCGYNGVTFALLRQKGFKVVSDEEWCADINVSS